MIATVADLIAALDADDAGLVGPVPTGDENAFAWRDRRGHACVAHWTRRERWIGCASCRAGRCTQLVLRSATWPEPVIAHCDAREFS